MSDIQKDQATAATRAKCMLGTVKSLLLLGGLSFTFLSQQAVAGNGALDIDINAEMAAADWWLSGTDVILVVRQVPFSQEFPVIPWPEMVSYDDVLGTTRVTRAVVEVEESVMGSVARSRIELWGAGEHPVAAPVHGIVFASLWNLEGAGFDPSNPEGVQFYASDALYSYSPERVLLIQEDTVIDIRRRPLCMIEGDGWFRACNETETPPSVRTVIDRIRDLTSTRQGASLEGFDQ